MWAARDQDNGINLFHNKPYRSTNSWRSKYEDDIPFLLLETQFPHLKWEDEPIEVTLSIKHSPEEIYALAEKAYKDGGYDIPEQTMFGTVNVDFTNFRWGFEEGYYCK